MIHRLGLPEPIPENDPCTPVMRAKLPGLLALKVEPGLERVRLFERKVIAVEVVAGNL